MSPRGRRAGLAGGVLAAAALLSTVPSAVEGLPEAHAQSTQESADLELFVEGLRGVLTTDDEFDVQLRIPNTRRGAVEDLRVVGTLHTAVGSRFALQQAVDDDQLGSVVDSFAESVDRLPKGENANVRMTREADELGFTGDGRAGVYPLRLQLREDGEVIDQLRTAVVFTPSEVEQPLQTAFVLPVDGPPLTGAGGEVDTARLSEQLGADGRARQLVAPLAAGDPFPLTLALNGAFLDHIGQVVRGEQGAAAERATRFLDGLREVAGSSRVETLGMPYGRADLVALTRGGMAEEAVRHVQEGRDTVGRHVDTPTDSRVVWPPDGLDGDTLAALTDAGADTVMLGEDYLSVPRRQQLSPSPVRELRDSDDGETTALVPDPWLADVLAAERFAATRGPALTAQRVLAETAAAYFERPFTDEARGLLLAPPQSWEPPEELVTQLGDALTNAPWLRPVGLSTLERTIEPPGPPITLDYPEAARDRELPSQYVDRLRHAREELGALSRVLPADPQIASSFDGLVRMAASVHYRRHGSTDTYSAFPVPLSEGGAMLNEVLDTAQDVFSSVEVVEGPRVLIDEQGDVPVTLANESRLPLRLRVRLLTGRFSFPADSGEQVVTVGAGEQRTLTFRAQAITPGARSPIAVVVEDPEGVTLLAEGRVVVRSTGVSVAGLVATVGAGLFLTAWAIRQLTRRRRTARQHQALADHAVQPVPPEPTVTAPGG